jgi:hypothetical protein
MTKEEIKKAVTEILDGAENEEDYQKALGGLEYMTVDSYQRGEITLETSFAIIEAIEEYKRPTKGEGK